MSRKLRRPTWPEFWFILVLAAGTFFLVYGVSVQRDLSIFFATAVGSLAYVVFSIWDSYVASPRLEIIFEADTEPYNIVLAAVNPSTGQVAGRFSSLRVLIRNNGSRAAKGAVGYIQLVQRETGCTMFSKDPKVLSWVSIP